MQSSTRSFSPLTINLLLALCSCVVALIFLEITFRILPTSDATYIQPTSKQDPIIHYAPNRDYLYSKGWNFSIQGRKNSNNVGFINNQDYYPKKELPIISVIGDSFIVANQIDNSESYPALLSKALPHSAKVYSFGVVGAPLSQYLKFALLAKEKYKSEFFIFNIVGNDFHESLLRIKGSPGFHYFKESDGNLELTHIEFPGHKIGIQIIRNLAIARYLVKNIPSKSDLDLHKLFQPGKPSKNKYVGYIKKTFDDQTVRESKQGIDKFFELLGNTISKDPSKVVFVLDGLRPNLYSNEGLKEIKGSFIESMFFYFKVVAKNSGYKVIDMQEFFIKDYNQFGEKFEFQIDGHWNELAHYLVTQNLLQYSFISDQFQQSPLGKRPKGQIY